VHPGSTALSWGGPLLDMTQQSTWGLIAWLPFSLCDSWELPLSLPSWGSCSRSSCSWTQLYLSYASLFTAFLLVPSLLGWCCPSVKRWPQSLYDFCHFAFSFRLPQLLLARWLPLVLLRKLYLLLTSKARATII
jgi:hypothetical protein